MLADASGNGSLVAVGGVSVGALVTVGTGASVGMSVGAVVAWGASITIGAGASVGARVGSLVAAGVAINATGTVAWAVGSGVAAPDPAPRASKIQPPTSTSAIGRIAQRRQLRGSARVGLVRCGAESETGANS